MKRQVKTGSGGRGIFDFGFWIGGIALPLLAVPPMHGAGPTAQEILQGVRMNHGSLHRVLGGQLDGGEKNVPFRFVFDGGEIRYEFTKPDQTLVLKLDEKGSRLDEITNEGTKRVTAARFDTPVRGTDITYEDIALRFLYWPDAKILREDDIDITRCYLIELHPGPGDGSQYGKVLAWIGKTNGVLRQAECYDPGNRLAARFKLVSAQKLTDGTWFLKRMRVERMHEGKPRTAEPTYIEITGEEK